MWFFFMMIFNTVSILWQNTQQLIPVGDDLTPYKSKPYAELHINQNKINDPKMFYEYEVEHTFFSVVNTNVIGTYIVKYKVNFPTYGFSAVEAISFDVRDFIQPTIIAPESIDIDLGTKNIDYTQFIVISDNYNTKDELVLSIQSHLVNTSVLGIYPVYINVKDSSNNQSNVTMHVKVRDQIPPSITQKKTIELGVNETFVFDNYFTIKDNYDAVFVIDYDDSLVNYQKPGTYLSTLEVSDQSGNLSVIQVYVYIKDKTSPILRLTTSEIIIDYEQQISIEQLKSFIVEVSDDTTTIDIDDVVINNYVDSKYLGTYEVIYEVFDEHQNKTSKILNVVVKDLSDPVIEVKEDIIIDVHTYAPIYLDYLEIYDNYSTYADLIIEIKSNEVKVQIIGQYWIYVTVKDTSKNEVTKQILVQVLDRINPEMTLPNSITITDFKKPDYQSIITIVDNYDKNPRLIIHDDDVTYHVVGDYEITVDLYDQSDNHVSQTTVIKVIDTFYPILKLYTEFIKHDYTKDKPYYPSYIKEVYDVYDKELTIDDVVIIDHVEYDMLGLYEVVFELTDPQGLKTTQTLFVDVTDFTLPSIELNEMQITQGDSFILTDYVTAYDDYDGDLTTEIRMNPSTIPTHIPGIYEIVFYVHDSAGNYTQQKGYLTVLEKDIYIDYIYYGIGILSVAIIYTLYFFYRRRHPKIS